MSERRTRTLPIRRWLVLALVVVFVIPVMVTGSLSYKLGLFGEEDGEAAEHAAAFLREGADRWQDPAWQAAARARLTADGVDFILYSGGDEIARSVDEPLAGTREGRRRGPSWASATDGRVAHLVTIEGSDPLLTAYTFEPVSEPTRPWLAPIIGATMLFLTLGGIGWIVGRMVVRPLATTGRAARLFATGDLDAALPSSTVREIAEVNAAFEAMRAGLRESLAGQAALEQERRFLISAVAHDLRTPLFSLRGYLEGLEQGVADTPEKRARYLAVAREKAGALEHLVSDLFDYSRLEFLELGPEREALDLAALLRRQAEAFQPLASGREVRLTFEPGDGCVVQADEHLLARAMTNLLDNAVRYTPAGGEVELRCGGGPDGAWFTIADTGPGIPEADLPHLFEPLYRGESSRNSRTGGAGIGLTIARRILLAHGGDLTAANRPEGGAIFRATLGPSRER